MCLVKSVVAKAAPAVLITDVVEAVDEATVLRLREARREASSPAQVVIAEIAGPLEGGMVGGVQQRVTRVT